MTETVAGAQRETAHPGGSNGALGYTRALGWGSAQPLAGNRNGASDRPVIDHSARVHATADIEPDVTVGAGTTIWHRAQVRTGARLGADCIIGRDAFIDEGVAIGDRVKIQNGALVYHGVTVGNGVFIGPGAILTNDRYPRAITS